MIDKFSYDILEIGHLVDLLWKFLNDYDDVSYEISLLQGLFTGWQI